VHSSQGLDRKNVYFLAESWRKNLINSTSYFTAQTRAKINFNLYTDSVKGLIKALEERDGQKESALANIMMNKQDLKKWL